MQLKNKAGTGSLRAGLMAATCALLSPATRAQSAPGSEQATETQIDSGLLYYQEDHGRVRSIDAIVKLNRDLGDDRRFGATVAVDSLSGGSPNGAIASRTVQTFATPSGSSLVPVRGEEGSKVYTTAPGAQPLDPNFRDLRVAADANWSQPLGIGNRMALGGHLSLEHDFFSASANGLYSHDFNSKNTTLGLGLNAEFDRLKPIGGVPLAHSLYSLFDKTGSNESKTVLGAQLGLTQVLARNWITQLNFSVDRATGYLSDPYKILSQVGSTGLLTNYYFESRPDTRVRRSVYLGNKVALGRSVLDLSYRYGSDDWGIRSHTVEAHYRIPLGASIYLEPQLRAYKQSAADFYHLYLAAGDPVDGNMSADPRLAAFTAKTIGLKLGVPMGDGDELSVRLEAYQQDAKQNSSSLSALTGLDLNPRLRSIVLQLGWRFGY